MSVEDKIDFPPIAAKHQGPAKRDPDRARPHRSGIYAPHDAHDGSRIGLEDSKAA